MRYDAMGPWERWLHGGSAWSGGCLPAGIAAALCCTLPPLHACQGTGKAPLGQRIWTACCKRACHHSAQLAARPHSPTTSPRLLRDTLEAKVAALEAHQQELEEQRRALETALGELGSR